MGFKEAREQAGLSPMQAAVKLKVSLATLYNWESGRFHPTWKRMPEVAELYRCSVDELLGLGRSQQSPRDRPA